jgi:hypothetical protein
MNYAVEMDFGAMILHTKFHKMGPAFQHLVGKIHKHTDSKVITYVHLHLLKITDVG